MNMKRLKKASQSGQVLVILLFFMVITIIITVASVTLIILNSQGASRSEQGQLALDVAESGAENAIIRLLRNPNYSGEALTVGEGTATITVAGTDEITVVSVGRVNTLERTVQVTLQYQDNILTVASWREIN